jgi:hypothetical protein
MGFSIDGGSTYRLRDGLLVCLAFNSNATDLGAAAARRYRCSHAGGRYPQMGTVEH